VFQGITKYPHKIVSLFEPHTEIIRKGKASKPNEFGNVVKVQEAENQIITHYEVFGERPEDSQLLAPAVQQHQRRFGRAPRMVADDTGFYSLKNEKTIQAMGVTRVAVPSRSTKKQRAEKTAENALVPGWTALADRMRRPHQRVEASPWIESLPVPRL
jgi:IS5 family transposase